MRKTTSVAINCKEMRLMAGSHFNCPDKRKRILELGNVIQDHKKRYMKEAYTHRNVLTDWMHEEKNIENCEFFFFCREKMGFGRFQA